jgi:hypothetical protein
MANIKGIRVDLETASNWWAPSADAFFLGVHGDGGGREFRLNGNVQLSQTSNKLLLVLGDACCKTQADLQVQYSTGLGDNDPLLNPIDLQTVRYVYLRKETTDSTTVNDDALALSKASVLLCDTDGTLRRFRKTGKIGFSDEVGLQHWLGEVSPPTCQIYVRLKEIRHHRHGTYSAGKNWGFSFGADVSGDPTNIISGLTHQGPTNLDWGFSVDRTVTISIPGCCGQTRSIVIHGAADEGDVFHNDKAELTKEITVQCNKDATTVSDHLELIVQGNIKSHQSLITFEYDVTSVCVD